MSKSTYDVFYSPEAEIDLRAIYTYIAIQLKAGIAAKAQVNRIRKEINSLSFMPERYEQVGWEPWHSEGVRKLPVDNYVIFYRVCHEPNEVEIARIFYGGQDIESIINEK